MARDNTAWLCRCVSSQSCQGRERRESRLSWRRTCLDEEWRIHDDKLYGMDVRIGDGKEHTILAVALAMRLSAKVIG